MTRLELMELAEECSDVLTAMEDDLLQNIAEYLSEGRADIPTAQWKIQQLAALGKLDRANIRTIAEYSDIAADMEEIAMTRAALAAVKDMDEGFGKLVSDGIIEGTTVPMEETALQAAAMYSKQAKDRLNKVNTVMRYFAKTTAAAAVNKTAEIVNKQQHLDTLNKAAGKVIMGAESRQTAVRQCIKEMSEKGIPAFVDAAGRQWSPEAYVNMDVRTTCSNAAHEAQFSRMNDYDIDLLEVDSHAGARPKCSLDQGRIFSKSGKHKKYPAWKTSSYGEPDGILGINCGHHIYPFIEGVSTQTYFPYDKEENDKLYKQKQEQRRLEREVRSAKREVSMLNSAGDKEGAKAAKDRVKRRTAAYNEYCEKTGLPRKADRLTVQGYRTKANKELAALNNKMASSTNDWSKTVSQKHSAEELEKISAYAKERGVKLYQPNTYDGDIEMLRQQIDTISSLKTEYNINQKITLRFTNMSDDDFAETVNNTICFNNKAMRNAKITNQNLNADNQLAATDFTGIAVHEMGHIISRTYGEKGLDIAKQAYYNIFKENISQTDLLDYLCNNVSEYSIFVPYERQSRNVKLKEITPEILSKSKSSNSNDFSEEFIKLLKEAMINEKI